jgi:DNA-binding transcriptional ArsR family regulator
MTSTDVFAALASPVRRQILNLLLAGPQPVNDIAARFDMRRPSVSEHLKVLRDAGLVSEQRDGRQRFYRLEASPLEDLRDWLTPYERFWRGSLHNLRDLLDRDARDSDALDSDPRDALGSDPDVDQTDDAETNHDRAG